MGITVDMTNVKERLDAYGQTLANAIPEALASVGQWYCDQARDTKTYTDRTGHLSASIGYGVTHNGQLVATGGFLGGEGEEQGMATLRRALADAPQDNPSLIIVAGMHYALYVNRKGFAIFDGVFGTAETLEREIRKHLAA